MIPVVLCEDASGWCVSGQRVRVDGVEITCLRDGIGDGFVDVVESTDDGRFVQQHAGQCATYRLFGIVEVL